MAEVFDLYYDTVGNLHYRTTDGYEYVIRKNPMTETYDYIPITTCRSCVYWDMKDNSPFDKCAGERRCWCKMRGGYWGADEHCIYGERREE